MERHQAIDAIGHLNRNLLEGDLLLVHRQPVKRWTVSGGKSFQLIQGLLIIKDLGVALDSKRCIEDPGTATGTLLAFAGVRC